VPGLAPVRVGAIGAGQDLHAGDGGQQAGHGGGIALAAGQPDLDNAASQRGPAGHRDRRRGAGGWPARAVRMFSACSTAASGDR